MYISLSHIQKSENEKKKGLAKILKWWISLLTCVFGICGEFVQILNYPQDPMGASNLISMVKREKYPGNVTQWALSFASKQDCISIIQRVVKGFGHLDIVHANISVQEMVSYFLRYAPRRKCVYMYLPLSPPSSNTRQAF